MSLTFGTTGMDRATEAEVHAAFTTANNACGKRWSLVSESSADYIVVDMDSLYGPMSWLKLHGAGRKVIGLTSASRSKTPYRLPRPINADDLTALLTQIENEEAGIAVAAPSEAAAHSEAKPLPATVEEFAAMPVAEPEPESAQAVVPEVVSPAPAASAAAPAPVQPEPQPAPAAPPQAPRTLRGWMGARGARRIKVTALDGTVVLVDMQASVWHGPKELKAIGPCFSIEPGEVTTETLDDAHWAAEAAKLGEAQPLTRLQWLDGLLSAKQTHGLYQLRKWPQIEREYPRHFRIATIMMKGAASIADIAVAAGVPDEEVRDFVNANLATGYAMSASSNSPAPTTPSPAPAPGKPAAGSGGLFGRLKK